MESWKFACVAVAMVIAIARILLARRTNQTYNTLSYLALLFLLVPTHASFLFPPSRGGASKATICLSNIKQLNLGLIMYANENDGHLPTRRPLTASIPYLKRPITECPADPMVHYGVNSAVLGPQWIKVQDRDDILLSAETLRRDELLERNADLAYPHTGRSTIGRTDGSARRSPDALDQFPLNVSWKDGVPVRLRAAPARVQLELAIRQHWEYVVVTLFFGGFPFSLGAALIAPKTSPRRAFWRRAGLAWAVTFLLYGFFMGTF